MLAVPAYGVPEFPEEVQILRCLRPSADYYRFLYQQVGRDWQWKDRDQASDEELFEQLALPGLELWVLYHEGHPAGYSELKFRQGEVQLLYFGLFPAFIGQGLGRKWLEWTVCRAWQEDTQRLWVHTCTLDHPNALRTYQKVGFQVYRRETKSL